MNLPLPDADRLIASFDRALRTLRAPAMSVRRVPGEGLREAELSEQEKRHAAALMRVNHTGEICAQALYQGQALTARNQETRAVLERAADEEVEHLAWTAQRVEQLGGRLSLLNPLFYAGAFAMGALSGLRGDKWNLGFLAETERQVEGHLGSHLDRLPGHDEKSRAIVRQMKEDEARHASSALDHGAAELPEPVKQAMRLASKVMTGSTYWV
ncbi:MAG TPA: 2-polyprenyl-3-methyl-6-methoxy-1,4-benzoquinone monooxygenase [Burkholderiales bacterium]